MNVRLARFSAIWCEASDTASSRPASALAAANTPSSSVTCVAAGSPSRSSRERLLRFGFQATLKRLMWWRRSYETIGTSSTAAR